jgi:catechol 2,3-dioxygenase-like lactoylglutathione lyase family enzyme
MQRDNPNKAPEAIGTAPGPYVTGVTIGVTIDDTEKTARFYRDVLGLDVKTGPSFIADTKQMEAFGLKGAQYRESAVAFPERTPQLHFFEFKGVERKPLHPFSCRSKFRPDQDRCARYGWRGDQSEGRRRTDHESGRRAGGQWQK